MSHDIGVWTKERKDQGIRLLAGTRFIIGFGFTTGAVARNAADEEVRPESPEAESFTLVGAARKTWAAVVEFRETPFAEFAAMLRDALRPATRRRPLNAWSDAQTQVLLSQELTKAIGRPSQYPVA